jgi:hypothetical protein
MTSWQQREKGEKCELQALPILGKEEAEAHPWQGRGRGTRRFRVLQRIPPGTQCLQGRLRERVDGGFGSPFKPVHRDFCLMLSQASAVC